LGTRRAVAAWSPFFAYFLWRSKESEWLSGHTRPTNRRTTRDIKSKLKKQKQRGFHPPYKNRITTTSNQAKQISV
jgi:hypothetical protein